MFDKLLIANRGEIARRIIRTCRRLNVGSVAVFSDADAGEPHVREADQAIRLGPAPATDSYLSIDRLVEAARQAAADAVHPGYGFLAENADFAAACRDADLTYVGPMAETVRLMGDKAAAKRHLEAAGVPVVPGVHDADLDDHELADAATEIGFPVLVKAVAGGGGKGMRQVTDPDQLGDAITGARREARGSFGDDRLLVEKIVQAPRHVEFQILGDNHGNLVHVFERECSIQRRHQKIIEETPSPALDDELRTRMGAAAVDAAVSVDYLGAGTVEMLLSDTTGDFYFLEMNTRLQVEHPVTELVTGLDLVEWQLRIAAGEPLAFTQDDLTSSGHAVEARLYAEDPADDFLPQTGSVLTFDVPDDPNVRVDAGVVAGSEVTPHYDPMLAKVIAAGTDRGTAISRLVSTLRETAVLGLVTNLDFLADVVAHPAFAGGKLTTSFLDDHLPVWSRPAVSVEALAAAAASLSWREQRVRTDPWSRLGPWRVGDVGGWHVRLMEDTGSTHDLVVARGRDRLRVDVDGEQALVLRGPSGKDPRVTTAPRTAGGRRSSVQYRCDVAIDGRDIPARVALPPRSGAGQPTPRFRRKPDAEQVLWVHVPGVNVHLTVKPATQHVDAAAAAASDVHVSPMPGTVAAVNVVEGDEVDTGQVLVVIEAMKMEHPVRAPATSTVTVLHVEAGEPVEADQPLIELEPLAVEQPS